MTPLTYRFFACLLAMSALAIGCGASSEALDTELAGAGSSDASPVATETGGNASASTGGSSAFATGGSVTNATGGQQSTATGGTAATGGQQSAATGGRATGGSSSTLPACPTGTPCAGIDLTACAAYVAARQACTSTLCTAAPGSECTSGGTCPTGYRLQSFKLDFVCCKSSHPYSDNPTAEVIDCGIYGTWRL